ncbi:hypothetical protein DIPPA_07221 [Diplonema papillatum]|nr:hypothetical protein DIPPA_07221 [Diplonema papillatum]
MGADGVDRASDRLNIQGTKTPMFYVSLAEKILTDEATLHIHALGSCIEACVGVADKLQRNGLAKIVKIKTDKSGRSDKTAQMVISVERTPEFAALYAEQKKAREEKAAAAETEEKTEA